jgi:hypothetical protein
MQKENKSVTDSHPPNDPNKEHHKEDKAVFDHIRHCAASELSLDLIL